MRLRGTVCALFLCASEAAASDNVILVTLDGVRIQELFSGMDPSLLGREEDSGIYDEEVTRSRYWRETPEERREVLMPFFWKTLAPMGVVLGNKAKGSRVTVKNEHWFSYPGYSEILTGRPQPDVDEQRYRPLLSRHRPRARAPEARARQERRRPDRLLGRIRGRGVEPRRRFLHERRL